MKKFNRLFQELNTELKKIDRKIDLICVGGFVLEYYSIRSTIDVDAFFENDSEFNALIKKVGDKLHANEEELWLNNSVSTMNEKPDINICKKIYSLSHINIYIPPIEYIIGMKATTGREKDVEDIGLLIKVLNDKEPYDLKKRVDSYGFHMDESILLEGYGNAYGFDWLVDFYKKNELSHSIEVDEIENQIDEYDDFSM